jgi:hypothetical protein
LAIVDGIESGVRFLNPADRARVDAELQGLGIDLAMEQDLAYGGSYVLAALWRRLDLDKTLEELLRERQYEIEVEHLTFAMGDTADPAVVGEVQGDLAGWRLNWVVWMVDRG